LLDLDRFKSINDTFGHPAGDAVLCGVAKCLEANLWTADLFGRWGGEEFLLLMPSTTHRGAMLPLHRLLNAVRQNQFEAGETKFGVTASIGIAEISDTDECFAALVSRADQALYRAKSGGRDRVFAA